MIQGEDLSSTIILNAKSLFAKSGYNKTSIQEIANLSKTSQTNDRF